MLHKTMTLSGAAQRLLDAFPTKTPGGKDDPGLRDIMLQGDGANANPVFVGGDNTVSITDYGWRIDKATGGIPAPGLEIGPFDAGAGRFGQTWVIGTAGEKLHILAQEF